MSMFSETNHDDFLLYYDLREKIVYHVGEQLVLDVENGLSDEDTVGSFIANKLKNYWDEYTVLAACGLIGLRNATRDFTIFDDASRYFTKKYLRLLRSVLR